MTPFERDLFVWQNTAEALFLWYSWHKCIDWEELLREGTVGW